jgi:bifunctional DNA-binding transcriptional regulator/antitoxin component of YhaV-PrlF toxin-antitoxin module
MYQSESIPSRYIIDLEEDEDGNLIIPFPDELLETLGWGEGTELDIQAVGGSIILRAVTASEVATSRGDSVVESRLG